MAPGILRLAREDDAEQIAAIYAPYASGTAVSFADRAPTAEEYRDRIRTTTARLPWIVCERNGIVAGYAYANPHRTSPAYRWSVETSIYVHAEHHRTGVGRALYAALLETLHLLGYHRAYAGVTDPNPASVGLHEAVGFERFAMFDEVGYKLGAWQSVIWLVYPLGNDDFPPTEPRLLPDSLGTPEWNAALAAGQALLH
ncbi:MAG: N-acetyltransferase family protein [Chloroflexi bacterium]|nr:N-acetyltransferase family protein [Chloroflexota bacterium]